MDMTDGGADHFYPNERWCTAPLNVGRLGGPSAASSPTRLSAAPGRTHPVTLMNMRSAQTRRAPRPDVAGRLCCGSGWQYGPISIFSLSSREPHRVFGQLSVTDQPP